MIVAKRVPVPLVFSLVLALVLALIIFFGAWAVSADVGTQRTLAFGIPGTTATLSGTTVDGADNGAYQTDQIGGHELAGDTWWGNAFLSACPLH